MARAHAANGPVQPGTLQGLARALIGPDHVRMGAYEPWLRRLVPLMVAVFMATLLAGVAFDSHESYDRALADAVGDIEMTAGLTARDLGAAIAQDDKLDITRALERSLPSRARRIGSQVLVADLQGNVVASSGAAPGGRLQLTDLLGPAQPLTVFADKAGVLRITLPDGQDVIAAVHALRPPFGQLAIIHPVAALLEDWHAAFVRSVVLLGSTAFVLTVMVLGYLWQARRAAEVDAIHARVHGRIDTALNRGRCGLWDWDLKRGRVYWSASMYAILNMEAQSSFLSFGDVNALVHPADENLSSLAEALASSKTDHVDHTFRLRNQSGDWVWLCVRAELVRDAPDAEIHLVGIAVDITAEQLAAERNAAADERLRDAIEAVSEAFVLWDADNCLVTCNSKFLHLYNLPPHRAEMGTPYASMIGASMPPLIQTQIPLGESPRGGARSYEAQLGDGRWLQINERRTQDGGYVSVGTDITALKHHEEQLLESERRLMATIADLRRSRQALEAQAQQLAELADRHAEKQVEAETANRSKSEFLANMSHELRTPLNAIIGFSELMTEEPFGPLGSSKYKDYVADISTSGRYLLAVISDVLEMARLDSGKVKLERRLVDIEQTIMTVMETYGDKADQKGLSVLIDVSPGSIVHADQRALETIVSTLVDNAIKFTLEGGQIVVKTRSAGGALNIFVEDSGIGITPSALGAIGRPFEQVGATMSNGMKGSGLGLAIARSLLEMHGGQMRIRSALGVGTIVMARIPAERHWAAQKGTTKSLRKRASDLSRSPSSDAGTRTAAHPRALVLPTTMPTSRPLSALN